MKNESGSMLESVMQLEGMESRICNLPLLFAEILKDEINANDEHKLYNGVKRIVKKYGNDAHAAAIMDELVSVLSGGASLEEILQVTMDEAQNPSITSDLMVDKDCELKS